MTRTHELSHHNTFVSRAGGASAVASSAYLAREDRTDDATGQRWNYSAASHHADYVSRRNDFSDRDDLAFSEVRLPPGAPEWMKDGATLWNRADAHEDAWADRYYRRRPDLAEHHKETARIALKGHISLARELDKDSAVEVSREIMDRKFISRGMAVEWALHWKEGQPHLHYQATARTVNADGFGKQARTEHSGREYAVVHLPKRALGDWNRETREIAAEVQNRNLTERGINAKVEHLSFADRGITFLPEVHEGPGKGRDNAAQENERRRAFNADHASVQPASVVRQVFANQAVATEGQIKAAIFKRVHGDDLAFEAAWSELRASSQLVSLGDDAAGRAVFTSREYLDAEKMLRAEAASLAGRFGGPRGNQGALVADTIARYEARKTVESGRPFALKDEQKEAIRHVVGGGDMAAIVGRAGTGKTTIMEVAREVWQAEGRDVRGAATAAIAADNLEREAGIKSGTIAKILYDYKRVDEASAQLKSPFTTRADQRKAQRTIDGVRPNLLKRGDVLVVDEAGMVGTREMGELLYRARVAGAKVVVVGDHEQISSVTAGQAFRLIQQDHGAAVLSDIQRQRDGGDRAASIAFTEGRISEAVEHYRSKGAIHFHEEKGAALDALAGDYVAARGRYGAGQVLATATRNEDVDRINTAIRYRLHERGELGREVDMMGRRLAIRDEVVFLENQRHVGVLNGTRAHVSEFIERDGQAVGFIAVTQDGRAVRIDYEKQDGFAPWSHSYCVTGHKSQGQTRDAHFHYAAAESRSSALVAGTRHRQEYRIYADRQTYRNDYADLVRDMSRDRRQDLVDDYTVTPNREVARERVARYSDVCRSYAAVMADAAHQADHNGTSIFEQRQWAEALALKDQRTSLAKEIAGEWEAHRGFAKQAGIRRDDVEVAAGLRVKTHSDADRAAQARVVEYADKVHQAREQWNEIKATHPGARSKAHPDYDRFDQLRRERDTMAAEIAGDRKTHAPFARDAGITWTSIQSQARQHEERRQIEAEQERQRGAGNAEKGEDRQEPAKIERPADDQARSAGAEKPQGLDKSSAESNDRREAQDQARQEREQPAKTERPADDQARSAGVEKPQDFDKASAESNDRREAQDQAHQAREQSAKAERSAEDQAQKADLKESTRKEQPEQQRPEEQRPDQASGTRQERKEPAKAERPAEDQAHKAERDGKGRQDGQEGRKDERQADQPRRPDERTEKPQERAGEADAERPASREAPTRDRVRRPPERTPEEQRIELEQLRAARERREQANRLAELERLREARQGRQERQQGEREAKQKVELEKLRAEREKREDGRLDRDSRDRDPVKAFAALSKRIERAEARGADPQEIARLRHEAKAKVAEIERSGRQGELRALDPKAAARAREISRDSDNSRGGW